MRGGHSEECRTQLSSTWLIQVQLLTQAVKRPSSTGGRRPDTNVESATQKVRPDRDEAAADLVAHITIVDSLWCVKPSIDLTNDAVAWSGKSPVAELEKGRTRELDTSILVDAFGEISGLPRGQKAYDRVLGGKAWRRSSITNCVVDTSRRNNNEMICLLELETIFMRYLIIAEQQQRCAGQF